MSSCITNALLTRVLKPFEKYLYPHGPNSKKRKTCISMKKLLNNMKCHSSWLFFVPSTVWTWSRVTWELVFVTVDYHRATIKCVSYRWSAQGPQPHPSWMACQVLPHQTINYGPGFVPGGPCHVETGKGPSPNTLLPKRLWSTFPLMTKKQPQTESEQGHNLVVFLCRGTTSLFDHIIILYWFWQTLWNNLRVTIKHEYIFKIYFQPLNCHFTKGFLTAICIKQLPLAFYSFA